ncbi:MAG: hypothetical protein MUC83_13600, partial [Pirellula sp.]|nr:hypothetical protein [Pirellula sp.]
MAHNPSLANAIRTQGVYAVTEVQTIPVVLPCIVDALQANDAATRNAATKAISNVVLKLDRNTYRRVPIQNWNLIELQLERASTLLSLQPQHVDLQKEIDGLLRRVNSGEWDRQSKLRTRKKLNSKQLEFLADLSGSSSEGSPQRIHKFEKGIVRFNKEEKQEILEQFCQQAQPSLVEIIILSTDKHDDDFIESLLWLADEDNNATWEVLLASCCPQNKETRKRVTETILRQTDRSSLRTELLYALSRSNEMEPEHARRLLREFTKYIEQPGESDSYAFVNAMASFLEHHKGTVASRQLDELKQLCLQNILHPKAIAHWRSTLIGFVVDTFPNDVFVADTLIHLLKDSETDPSIQFDTLAAISSVPHICQRSCSQLLRYATGGDVPTQELALQGLALVRDLNKSDIENLARVAFDEPDGIRNKYEEATRVLAAKAIAAQGQNSIETLRSLLSPRMSRKANSEDLERLLRTIELSGQRDPGIDVMLSHLVKDPFRQLETRIAAWNARSTTAMLTDRVMKEIHYYLNDFEYEPEARATALSSLARICGACSIPKLSMYSHDSDPLMRISARFAHHYAGESATAARLLIDEVGSVVNDVSLSEEEKSQIEETIRDLILEIGDSADEALFVVLTSDTYTPLQKSIAFRTLASSKSRSWKKLLSLVNEADFERQFSREIRATWDFDSDLVPALYAKILTSNPETSFAQELWQIAEDTTQGLGAGDDGEFWGDNAMRVAISNHSQQSRKAPPESASASEPVDVRGDSRSSTAQSQKITESPVSMPAENQPTAILEGNQSDAFESTSQSMMGKPTRLMALNQNLIPLDEESAAVDKNDRVVSVFYGTNRQLSALPSLGGTLRWGAFTLSLGCFLICVVKFAKQKSIRFAIIALLGLLGLTSMARDSLDMNYWFPNRTALFTGEYSSEIKYGVCDVSIPPIHSPGELESPSLLLKWEVVQDPEK